MAWAGLNKNTILGQNEHQHCTLPANQHSTAEATPLLFLQKHICLVSGNEKTGRKKKEKIRAHVILHKKNPYHLLPAGKATSQAPRAHMWKCPSANTEPQIARHVQTSTMQLWTDNEGKITDHQIQVEQLWTDVANFMTTPSIFANKTCKPASGSTEKFRVHLYKISFNFNFKGSYLLLLAVQNFCISLLAVRVCTQTLSMSLQCHRPQHTSS